MRNGILWAFGDSFTAGNSKDISKGMPHPISNTIGKQRAYPQFLARDLYLTRDLNLRVVNLAKGGDNNTSIVNTLIKASPNFQPKNDFIVIGLTSPFRSRIEASPLEALGHLLADLHTIVKFLYGCKYIITSAFCPLTPYYFKSEDLGFKINNYIEWGKPNNTLLDICGDTWLDEKKINPAVAKSENNNSHRTENAESNIYLESCSHPSTEGHKLIAKTLLPYVNKIIK